MRRFDPALVLLCCLQACSSTPPATRDYLLRDPARTERAAAPTLPALRVRPLVARTFLDRKEIAWRQGDVFSGTYRYQRWAEPPAELLTRAIIDALDAGGAFASVEPERAGTEPPWTLSGELLGMHEIADDGGQHPQAVVEIALVLQCGPVGRGEGARRTLLRARRCVAAADESIDALVRAMSEAAQQVIEEVVGKLTAVSG